MQKVDYWFGIPLCFLLSCLNKILCVFKSPGFPPVKKILFVELSEMGSAIIAYSSIIKAQKLFPEAKIYFLIFERNRESVDLLGIIPRDQVIVIKDKNFFKFAVSAFFTLFRLRSLKIDSVLDLELFSRFTMIFSYLTGSPRRVGFYNYLDEGLYRGDLLTHSVQYNYTQHISLNFLNLINALSFPANERPLLKLNVTRDLVELPQLEISSEEKISIWTKLETLNPLLAQSMKLIVINPDPGLLPLRGWPLERYVELARLLEKRSDLAFVVVGLDRSNRYAQEISKVIPKSRFVDLTGQTKSLREVLVLLSISYALITSDSGPAHIASLTEINNFVLFGPETPLRYAPLSKKTKTLYAGLSCSPCYSAANHRRSSCKDNVCMKEISVDQVYQAVCQTL